MKARRRKGGFDAGDCAEARHQIGRALQAGRRHAAQALGTQQGHVNGGGRHHQPLIGANVRGRLAAPNVLLARLQGQAEPRAAFGVHRTSDDPPRHLPHELHTGGHESEIGTARRQRHAERLTLAADDVGAQVALKARTPLPRRRQQRHCDGVDDCNQQDLVLMRPVGELIGLFEAAEKIRLLHDQRGDVLPGIRLQRLEQREPCRFGRNPPSRTRFPD